MATDAQWRDAMIELLQEIEETSAPFTTANANPPALDAPPPHPPPSDQGAHLGDDAATKLAATYLRYLAIFRKLEEAYDAIIHPQKRRDIRKALDAVIGRVLELKEALVAHRPGRLIAQLDEILVDLKLTPDALEVPVPRFAVEDQAHALAEREKLLDALRERAKLGRNATDLGGVRTRVLSLEDALRTLQLNERGRQGRARAQAMVDIRQREERERRRRQRTRELDADVALSLLQRVWRGCVARRRTQRMRDDEYVFLGMRPPPPVPRERDPHVRLAARREARKVVQSANEAEYRAALADLDRHVLLHEGPDMKEEMMDQLREWYTKYREREGAFPPFPPPQPADAAADGDDAAAGAEVAGAKTDAKGKGAKKDAKGKGAKEDKKGGKGDKKGAKGKAAAADDAEPPPPLPAVFAAQAQDALRQWADKWQYRDESGNFLQKHEDALIKEVVRPEVELRVRDEVNASIAKELQTLKDIYEKSSGKGKKGAKGDKKGKKGKKGKGDKKGKKGKGGKKGTKGGKKAPKDPTAGKSIEYLYQQLVGEGIIEKVAPTAMSDYAGSFLHMGAAMDKLAQADPARFPDPSIAQVRAAVTEACVLPLASQAVKNHAPLNTAVKGSKRVEKNGTPVLLAGCCGTGKKLLVHAVASSTGANLFNLTPSNTAGKYGGKTGPTTLVHTVLKVAKALPPSVVWIGEAETVWAAASKKKVKEPANRILKPLMALLAPKKGAALLEPRDRVLVLGTTAAPYEVEKKKDLSALSDFFVKIFHLPLPDYAARAELWARMLQRAGVAQPAAEACELLARVSRGYSSGSICNVVRLGMSSRRVAQLEAKPFTAEELIGPLAKEEPVPDREAAEVRKWHHKYMGVGVDPEASGDDGGKEKKGKGKGDKKGKGGKKKGGKKKKK